MRSSDKEASDKVAADKVAADKAALRRRAAATRRTLHAASPDAGAAVRDRFRASFSPPDGVTLAAFWPLADEIDLRPLMVALFEEAAKSATESGVRAGVRIALPVVVGPGQALIFRHWQPGMVLEVGAFGVSIPPASAPIIAPDWLLVPLLAYDCAGYRLGYGGGFYDMTIAGLRAAGPVMAIGTGFDAQAVPRVPRDGHDARLDAIVTDRRTLIMDT